MMGRYIVLILFVFLVEAEVKSVMEGDPVILNSGVTKQQNETVWWYFNNILIGEIDGKFCLYDGEDGRFRDRLMLDYKTGSLIITSITTKHAGRYEAELYRSESSGKTEKLNRDLKCDSTRIIKKTGTVGEIIKSISLTVSASDSAKNKNEAQIVPEDKQKKINPGLSSAVVAGIVVGVLLLAAAVVVGGVIYFRHRSSGNGVKKNKLVSEPFLPAQNEQV